MAKSNLHAPAWLSLIALIGAAGVAFAEPVTVDNFVRAETDLYFANIVKDGGFGTFVHRREPAAIDKQTIIRLNRDTLYSAAIFDLDAGPVTLTTPETGDRFMSMMVINEDHYVSAVSYDGGKHTLTKEQIGTRYIIVGIRTFVDPADPKDIDTVHALQDAVKAEQTGAGEFKVPEWDAASQKVIRDALLTLATTMPDFNRTFGSREKVDPLRHFIGTAAAWGGNPDEDAIYLNVTPKQNDGKTIYKLDVADVPVEGFWSISVYNSKGYFEKNVYDAYSLNNVTAKKNDDGSFSIQFGGCDGKMPNCLPVANGWNYTVRLYRPRGEILNGSWQFPQPEAVM